jgi:hypothetical protein
MFSDGDQAEQKKLAKALEDAGFKVHMPQRDGIEVADVMGLLNDPMLHGNPMLEPIVLARCVAWVTRAVVALDVYEVVKGCQCSVLNIDGRVPDEGALVEATLAWSTGHPVVPYKTTPVSELGGNNNPMIGVISGWAPISTDAVELVRAVKMAVRTAGSTPLEECLPADVQDLVDLGRVLAGIRGKPLLNATQQAAAAATLAAIPPAQMELLEPVSPLQAMAQQVVLAIIQFSKLGTGQNARRRTLFQTQIAALQAWATDPKVRDAILNNPLAS